MNDFHRTGIGQKFFEKTLPELVKQITRLADGVERVVKVLEEDRAAGKGATKGEAQ